jgi:hypothetical protein
MRCLTSVLPRLIVRMMLGLCVVAVLLGRNTPVPVPEPGSDRRIRPNYRTSPRYHSYDGFRFPEVRHLPRLLDAETGAVLPFPLSDAESLDMLSCSPWRDGAGQFHLVGRWQGSRSSDRGWLPRMFGLAWCTFPGGEILDRIALDPIPLGNPCWYPDASGRVLYSSGARLYQVAFPSRDGGAHDRVTSGVSREIPWRAGLPGGDVLHIHDLHWSNVPSLSLEGRILVSLARFEPGTSSLATRVQIWWLDLGRDGAEIVAAGRLFSPDPGGVRARRAEERLPVVGPAHDGAAMLAYLVREQGRATWDLWVAPIAPRGAGQASMVLTSAGRRLAEGCEAAAPAFSADGRWAYVLRHSGGPGVHLERFPVAANDDPPRLVATSGSVW